MKKHILRVDASMRREGSHGRQLADHLVERLRADAPNTVTVRDLADGIAIVDGAWIDSNSTEPSQRSSAQRAVLAESDALVAELRAADALVVALPIYNFGVPAAFKAWVDQIARARETFRYSEKGPVGLLTGKRAYVILTSGGTRLGSDIDFVTPWLRHVLGFIGINDVEVIDATALLQDTESRVTDAISQIDELPI